MPYPTQAPRALTARPATESCIELVALALDAAAEGCRSTDTWRSDSQACYRAGVLVVLRSILGDAAPASDLLDARLNGEPTVLVMGAA